nr:MAG TPA: minor capsid protein [Caudoviricetes sp.]
MALNPDLLDSLPAALVEMYAEVEISILEDMAKRINTYDYFIPAAQHQQQKLIELGAVQSEIIAKLSAMTGKTQEEIIVLLSEASAEAIKDDVEYYIAAEVYEPSKVNTEALHAQLNAGLLQTQQAFFNITGTTANTATRQFEKALDRAWTQINTGTFDYNTAISNAIKDLSKAGIGTIEYKSGRIDNIEVAVRRAVVTGANQTAVKTQEVLADELGIDLVEITAHGGARPSHAKWQGKVFSRNGRVTIDGVIYEDLRKATGYGKAGGLCGVNCRHNFHPYIPGAPKAYSKSQLKDYEAKNIEYNGVKMTEYEASQIQRGIERNIRSLKRQVVALEAGGQDASAEKKLLREANKVYTDFTAQTGLKKQSARTKIATGTETAESVGQAKKAIAKSGNGDTIEVKKEKIRNKPLKPVSLSLEKPDELEQWQNEYYKKNKNVEFTKSANPAISQYSGSAYSAINAVERGGAEYEKALKNYGTLDGYKKVSDQLSHELSKFTLHTDIEVRRIVSRVDYITGSSSSIKDMKSVIGSTYTEKGFTSTTVVKDAQLPFGGMKETATVLDIVVPKKTRGAYIYKMADNPAEFEFLIDKNTDFEILDAGERPVTKTVYNFKTCEWEKVEAQERYMRLRVIVDE